MQETLINYLLHGVLAPSPVFLVGYFLLTSLFTLLAVSCFLHRSQTHRAIVFAEPLNIFFRLTLWFFTGMVTKEWVSVHRKHHEYCDTPFDPHSPLNVGLMKVLLEGADIYAHAGRDERILAEFGAGTPDDFLERYLLTPHRHLGIGITLVLEVICFGAPGLIIWALQMMVIPVIAAGFVNGVTHVYGYQRFKDGDVSADGRVFQKIGNARNVPTFGLAVGEEFHNNHHGYPNRYKFSHGWYEFDLAGTVSEILCALHLAWVPKKD